jgi:peptide/nickel transport system permease protein
MSTYIIRRLIQTIIVLFLLSLFVFFIIRLLPGDPILIYIGRSQQLAAMSPERYDQLKHEYGLDKPLVVQYSSWVGNIFRGDLGTSLGYSEDVGKLLLERFPVTLLLGVLALLVSTVFGISVGIIAAVRRGKWIDKIVTPLSYIGVTIPVFWLGILMIYAFGLKLHWLPTQGYTSPFDDLLLCVRRLIMPVICLSVFGLASNARLMRSSMLEVIKQDYIRTAWSKGLTERIIILRHGLKNSLIAVITLIGMGAAFIFGGSVLVETVFAIPGVGRLMVSSIFAQDYVVVQDITLIIAAAILVINLIVDIAYGWFDPRIRYG